MWLGAGDWKICTSLSSSVKWGQYYHIHGRVSGRNKWNHAFKIFSKWFAITKLSISSIDKMNKQFWKSRTLWNFPYYHQLCSFTFKITSLWITEKGRDPLSTFSLKKIHQNNLYRIIESIHQKQEKPGAKILNMNTWGLQPKSFASRNTNTESISKKKYKSK